MRSRKASALSEPSTLSPRRPTFNFNQSGNDNENSNGGGRKRRRTESVDEDEGTTDEADELDSDDDADEDGSDDSDDGDSSETARRKTFRRRKLAAARAMSEAARSVGDDTKEMSGTYADIAEGYRQEQMKHLDMQLALEEQQREILGSIAKYARLLAQRQEDKETLSKTIVALQQAIGALS